jgi:hypothetical protein
MAWDAGVRWRAPQGAGGIGGKSVPLVRYPKQLRKWHHFCPQRRADGPTGSGVACLLSGTRNPIRTRRCPRIHLESFDLGQTY